MIPDGYKPGDACPDCGHKFYREEFPGYTMEGCSEFCASVTEEEREAFKNFKEGDYGLFPCADCGCTMEDEYHKGDVCSDCHKKRYVQGLELLVLDLCDSDLRSFQSIQGETGLSRARVAEMVQVVDSVFNKYEKVDGKWTKK